MPEYKKPKSSKDQHAEQEDQYQAREARYHQEKNLPCRVDELGEGGVAPEENIQDVSAGPARTHKGKNHLTNHSITTHVVNQCSVKTQSD